MNVIIDYNAQKNNKNGSKNSLFNNFVCIKYNCYVKFNKI